uniref:DUF3017 domain-containing protein n=1 Tax=Vaginimicrobium propionicum TaxID=1871034 RepID=UPI0009FAA899|nr:DUF3017 domain-containing protein [Vaginimicrobium propionicum]
MSNPNSTGAHQAVRPYQNYLSPWALLACLTVFTIGIVLVVDWHWRRGTFVMGLAMLLAAILRIILPPKMAGLLVVRTKIFDVSVLLAGWLAITSLAVFVPGLINN